MPEKVTIGNCELWHGDCREILPLLPPVDLIFTSPPYNMNLRIRNGEYCSRQIVDEFSTKYEGYADNLPIDDYEALLRETIAMSLNVSPLVFWNIHGCLYNASLSLLNNIHAINVGLWSNRPG